MFEVKKGTDHFKFDLKPKIFSKIHRYVAIGTLTMVMYEAFWDIFLHNFENHAQNLNLKFFVIF